MPFGYLPRPADFLAGLFVLTWALAFCTCAVVVPGTFGLAATARAALARLINGFLDFLSSVILFGAP